MAETRIKTRKALYLNANTSKRPKNIQKQSKGYTYTVNKCAGIC